MICGTVLGSGSCSMHCRYDDVVRLWVSVLLQSSLRRGSAVSGVCPFRVPDACSPHISKHTVTRRRCFNAPTQLALHTHKMRWALSPNGKSVKCIKMNMFV